MADDLKIPLLEELEKGPWPSFVSDIKSVADRKPMAADLLRQLEKSYEDKRGYWKHGGLVGVMGYGGGVIGRYSALPEDFPGVSHFHTVRVNQPSGWFYTTDALREIVDIWDEHGSGLFNMHGSTGDMVLLGTRTEELEPTFRALTEKGWDLGGSGSDMRTPSCCVGPARCQNACYDTMDMTYQLTQNYQDELHRPMFNYKFKMKMSGCPNDCTAAIARSDMAVIGIWKDDIKVNQEEFAKYLDDGFNVQEFVVEKCPTRCITVEGKEINIDNSNCVKCMHCINRMPKALAVGDDKGFAINIGAKAPIVEGALFGSVIVPFMKIEDGDYEELYDFIDRMWEFWDEHGTARERIGEFIERVSLATFLEGIEMEPSPKMVKAPRDNPYIFYEEYFAEEDEGEGEGEE
ncbi:MAG: dissimilatory-type sulfite reductase subunit alpha [Thermoleophilia bacterium]|nr:dissimilatory-type sulfite reductase subunit alpha [Thermoleophilia bacterium]